jgi:hypothetical protein
VDVVIAEGIYHQVKVSEGAFRATRYNPVLGRRNTPLEEVQLWVADAHKETKDYRKIKYVVPPGVRPPEEVVQWLRDSKIEIIKHIPHIE